MCTLRVRGPDPRLAGLASEWALPECTRIVEGQRVDRASGRPLAGRKLGPGVYGFNSSVSNRDWGDLKGQFEDALAFIAQHREALLALRALRPTSADLDFPAESDPAKRHVILFDVTLPVDLCRAASEVGLAIEVTVYFATADGGQNLGTEPEQNPKF